MLLLIGAGMAGFASPAADAPREAAGKIVFFDDLGRRIELSHPVHRIVSLAPSATEILFAVGAGGKLVGDTNYCDYPPAAKSIPHVGGVIDPNREKIVALRPDLVIVASETISPGEADQLAVRYHAPVYVTAAHSYGGVIEDLNALGRLAGDPVATARAVGSMVSSEKGVALAVANRPKPRVFIVVWEKPLMTAGGKSFIGDLIRLAGGINVAERQRGPYPSYSEESLVVADPDILLASGASGKVVAMPSLPSLDRLNLRAIRQRHTYAVPEGWWERPGPRLRLGLLALARLFHPEAFATARQAR